jgi:drug/metabolite transporter (DMT)-like permease
MLGGVLAFLSAALFGYNNVATRRGVLRGTTLQGMAITVPMGVVLFAIACLIGGSLALVTSFSWPAYACFAMAGFMHFVFGRYCNYRAIAAIGTNLASPIQQLEVLVTLALALIILGERLTPVMILAIALLLLGPAIATRMERGGGGAPKAHTFEPRYAEGYTYAFLTIFGYGSSPIFIRAGLEGLGTIGHSLAGGLVSYIAATLIVAVVVVLTGQTRHVLAVDREASRWFMFAGLLVFLSQMFRYMALALVPVSVVAPIMRIQTLFRIYFSWLIARQHEVFDAGVIVGTVISMAGAILLTLQIESWLLTLALPDWLRALLAWRWP